MTDTASTILLTREQSTGSNTNLWGGYLITTQRQTEQAAKGYQALAVTGDATISWTNYTTGNTGQAAHLKLTGTLSSAATLTFPAYMNRLVINNQAGATVTIKCSAGTGVAIPNNRRCEIRCDGTDYTTDTPTYTADTVTLANGGDLVNYTALQAALAALVGTASGLVLNSAADTTAGYLASKVTGSGAVVVSTTSGGGNEKTNIAVGAHGLTLGSAQTTSFSAAINTRYPCNFITAVTITLPASATAGDVIEFYLGGGQAVTINPNGLKINASTNSLLIGSDRQTLSIGYTGTTDGWV